MSSIKVMISPFYTGGPWLDKGTGIFFDPDKRRGTVYDISKDKDITGITKYIRLNILLPIDNYDAVGEDTPLNPEVVHAHANKKGIVLSFNEPVYPLAHRYIRVTTEKGAFDIDVTDGYVENPKEANLYRYHTPIEGNAYFQVDDQAFINDKGLLTKLYEYKDGGLTPSKPVTGVSVNPTSINPAVGQTGSIVATVAPADADDKTVTWSSSDATIITVDNTGKWNALKVGTATITANASGKTAVVNVTVKAATVAVTGVSVNPTSITPTEGQTGTITATVAPSNATNKTVTFSSSDATIITVTNTGAWTAVKAGIATITAKTADGNKTATTTVTVSPAVILPTAVSVSPKTSDVVVGATGKLSTSITPATSTDKTVTWTSSDSNIVSIDANGNYTAKAVGTATITVKTVNNITNTATINVAEAPAG